MASVISSAYYMHQGQGQGSQLIMLIAKSIGLLLLHYRCSDDFIMKYHACGVGILMLYSSY